MLQPEQAKAAAILVRELRIAFSNYFLYSADNSMVKQSLEKFLAVLGDLFKSLSAVSLGESEGRLVVEGTALDERATGSTNMIKDLFLTHKIHSMTFQPGLQLDELQKFFELLKPRALPPGQTLFQAAEAKGIANIKVNEKMFVAVKEGERVVAAGTALDGLEKEENFQEALEALQYFLQIFARVNPSSNKKEVARKMMGQMGGILSEDDFKEVGFPVPAPTAEAQGNWGQIMGAFLAMKNNLASVKAPEQLASVQMSMDDLLKKLVLMGESQGFGTGTGGGTGGGSGFSEPDATEERFTLFETDPVLSALDENDFSKLTLAATEGQVVQRLPRLQESTEQERFVKLWNGLWRSAMGEPGEARNVTLRHLLRLDWAKLPEPLQKSGLSKVRELFGTGQTAESFPLVMSLYQNWVTKDLTDPDWPELILGASALKGIAFRAEQEFENQSAQAKTTLESVFSRHALDQLDALYVAPGKEPETRERLFIVLDFLTGPFFIQRAMDSPADSPAFQKAFSWLDRFQTLQVPVLERWFQAGAPSDRIRLFLEMFKKMPPSATLFDLFNKNWANFSMDQKLQVMEIAFRWRLSVFRPRLIELVGALDKNLSIPALRSLSKIGLEGDSLAIVEAVKAYGPDNPERDEFWIEACRVLGDLAEAYTINTLVEWADGYRFLEKKGERPMAVREAAVEALGHFRSQYVHKFLLKLEKDAEKELRPLVEQALKGVNEKLAEESTSYEQLE